MDAKDLIPLLLGLYAAVLSTYLGIRELRKEARGLTLFLTYIAFYELYAITITNPGHRPTTVSTVSIDVPGAGQVKESLIMQENEGLSFPFTLANGETANINLPRLVCDAIRDAKENIFISVYDSEGKVYNKYKKQMYNAKFGGLSPR